MSIAANNIFGRDGFFWWFGVVEDRMDPMLLGRCRVRIIGYHTDKQSELPTDDLPWAIPMQAITSAAISGKGDAPLGPLEGTWVIGFFADGKDCQQPVIMGTLGGLPGKTPSCLSAEVKLSNVQRDAAGNVLRDSTGNPIPNLPVTVNPAETASGSIKTNMPPLTQAQLQTVMDTVAAEASGSDPAGDQNYAAETEQGYVGKYQTKAQTLKDNGFLTGPLDSERTESELSMDSIWTGKNGINSLEDFKSNKNNCQEYLMFDQTYDNYKELLAQGVITTESPNYIVSGYLTAAHFTNAGTATDLKNGTDSPDETGVRVTDYFNKGVKALNGPDDALDALINDAATAGLPAVAKNYAGALNDPKLGNPAGFGDPNSKYPNCNYVARQDTNKLATNNDSMNTTILASKDKKRITQVQTANGKNGGKWEEPTSAFQGKYPYNKVKETESGHIVEFDDTPGAERIHIYHRTGTYVEIDKNGSVRQKVMGENYEIYTRNDNVYVQGNMNVTVDGAQTLLVKGAVDVEILGKTTVNIKNDAQVNVAGKMDLNVGADLNIIAQNINMQARQDINLTAGNYMNVKTGGDLNFTVGNDEQHRVLGSFDLDAITAAINSGTSNPFAAVTNPLSAVKSVTNVASNLKDPKSILSKTPLTTKLANPLNSVSKAMSGLVGGLGGITGANSILNKFSLDGITGNASLNRVLAGAGAALGGVTALSGLTGGAGSILNTTGVSGLNNILGKANLGSLDSILKKAGVTGIGNVESVLKTSGIDGLNSVIKKAGAGNLDSVLQKAGLNMQNLSGNVLGANSNALLAGITKAGVVPANLIDQGKNLTNSFFKNGAATLSMALPVLVNSRKVSQTEFKNWGFFPEATRLSKHVDLGTVSTQVAETNLQFPVMAQAGLEKAEIVTNLKALSVNALDPIFDRYPNAQVTDAFRPMNSYLAEVTVNNPVKDLMIAAQEVGGVEGALTLQQLLDSPTQYNLGQAANLQFTGMPAAEYYTVATWIRDNVAYDQLRLEYTTLGSKEPFITVTHNPDGNRPADALDKIVTCMNGEVIANFLVDMTSVA